MADITPNDLAALQDFPDYPFADIPISSDPIPYKHLQAKGRYHGHSIPNTIPPFLSILSASDTQFNPELLSTDGKRNLNVNVVNQSAGGKNTPGPFGAATYFNGQSWGETGVLLHAASHDIALGDLSNATYLYQMHISILTNNSGIASNLYGHYELQLHTLDFDSALLDIVGGLVPPTAGPWIGPFNHLVQFVPALDLRASFPTADPGLNPILMKAQLFGFDGAIGWNALFG